MTILLPLPTATTQTGESGSSALGVMDQIITVFIIVSNHWSITVPCNSLETELGLQEGQVLEWLTGLIRWHVLELILQKSLESDLSGGSTLGGLHLLLRNPVLAIESIGGKTVSGGDDVAEVHILNERLNSLSLESLSLGHSLGNRKGGLLDSDNKDVTVRSGLGTIIEDLHDDGLLTSLTSLSEDDNSSGFNATKDTIVRTG